MTGARWSPAGYRMWPLNYSEAVRSVKTFSSAPVLSLDYRPLAQVLSAIEEIFEEPTE